MSVPQRINENLDKYDKTYKQLTHILQDTDYYMNDGYREFVNSMMGAIGGGRKITTKMDSAITNVVRNYIKWIKKPTETKETRLQKKEKIERIEYKITQVQRLLTECDYTGGYHVRSDEFLRSVAVGVRKYGGLTPKQMLALNKMNDRFTKKLESQKK